MAHLGEYLFHTSNRFIKNQYQSACFPAEQPL